jgi:hypothetical protein
LLVIDVDVAAAMNVVRAAIVGDVKTVKQWLTAPHTRHPGHVAQVLTEAAEHGHVNICQLMLDSDEVPKFSISLALNAACRHNQQSTAQLLVRHGHINTHDLTKALLEACVHGHVRMFTWLTSDVMQLSQSDRTNWLLITVCTHSDLSVVKKLATQVVSDVTRVMSQALRVVCYNGRDDVVKWLMSHTTADANCRGVINQLNGKMTSLMAACYTGRFNIVRRLLQCVTPHTVNMMSGAVANAALHFTICCETDEHCRMQNACGNSDIDTVTATLYLSNINLHVVEGSTALHIACMRGHVEIVRMLLSAFADTHFTDDLRRTPLCTLNYMVTLNCCLTYDVHYLVHLVFLSKYLTTACQYR